MTRTLLMPMIVLACLGVLEHETSAEELSSRSVRSDSLYQAAIEQVGHVPEKESLKGFGKVVRIDRDYAPAHFEIAKLYMKRDTPMSRQSARIALDLAIRLQPENEKYLALKGHLLWAQGLWDNAADQYGKVLEKFPDHAEAAYMLGYYSMKNFLITKDREYGLPSGGASKTGLFNDSGEDSTGTIRHLGEQFAEEDFSKAVAYFERSIESDSRFRDAYYKLAMTYYEGGHPDELIEVSKRLLAVDPEDKDALLFCGLGYQGGGDHRTADHYYSKALERMDLDERTTMESVVLLASRKEREAVAGDEDSSLVWSDTQERVRFWKKQDPLFLTEFSERRMAHYGRVAYANLRFSIPSKSIAGWRTDRGKAYIKFGRYLHRSIRESNGFLVETWIYESFGLTFTSNSWLGKWFFAPGSSPPSPRLRTERVFKGRDIYTITNFGTGLADFYGGKKRQPGPVPSSGYVFSVTPTRYVDPYLKQKYSLPHQVVTFREGDSVRVEISYALPRDRVRVVEPEGTSDLENGIFLFNQQWDEAYRDQGTMRLKWSEINKSDGAADSLEKSHVIFQRFLRIDPGSYHLAVEAWDGGSGSVGTFKMFREIPTDDSFLSMSDLLLASHIEPISPVPSGREDLLVVPEPLRTFARSEPVSIYLEVYNLTRNRFGRTKFDISYRLGWPEEEVDPGLFEAQALAGPRARLEMETLVEEDVSSEDDRWDTGSTVSYRVQYVLTKRNRVDQKVTRQVREETDIETEVTARYEGDRSDDFTYLHIDVRQVPEGIHRLTVRLKDMYNGRVVERETLFRVME